MIKYFCIVLFVSILLLSCKQKPTSNVNTLENLDVVQHVVLDLKQAEKILTLPLECIYIEYPNKLGQVLTKDSDLRTPKQLRPIFYGCFDWHSSVHGFWSIVTIANKFPTLELKYNIKEKLTEIITVENVQSEVDFFNEQANRNFERTYGWAWLLTLDRALLQWNDPVAKQLSDRLKPLTNLILERYQEYLPKLVYPIRTGTHDNTAFGLNLALDYARDTKNKEFEQILINSAKRLYSKDVNCALSFEPSGSDFLSACLEQAQLMSKVLDRATYRNYMKGFLPEIFDTDFSMDVGIVSDRTDGHLVHLDGLNFSRATNLQQISKHLPELSSVLLPLAQKHFEAAYQNISDDDYMGSHWLGTFALYSILHQ